jgi:hypothetical protein
MPFGIWAFKVTWLTNRDKEKVNMDNITDENQARYHVVTLLHGGKLDEAEEALTTFSDSGIISCENEVFYRFLLEAAIRRSKSGLKAGAVERRRHAISEQKT